MDWHTPKFSSTCGKPMDRPGWRTNGNEYITIEPFSSQHTDFYFSASWFSRAKEKKISPAKKQYLRTPHEHSALPPCHPQNYANSIAAEILQKNTSPNKFESFQVHGMQLQKKHLELAKISTELHEAKGRGIYRFCPSPLCRNKIVFTKPGLQIQNDSPTLCLKVRLLITVRSLQCFSTNRIDLRSPVESFPHKTLRRHWREPPSELPHWLILPTSIAASAVIRSETSGAEPKILGWKPSSYRGFSEKGRGPFFFLAWSEIW